MTSLAIAGALVVTSPLSAFAEGKQDPGTANQPVSSSYRTHIQEVLKDLNLNILLEKYGIRLDFPELTKIQQQPVQPQPATTKKQPYPEKQPAPKQTVNQTPSRPTAPGQQQTSYTLSEYEQQVVDLTNKERAKYGLPALKVDLKLSKMARDKAQDMHDKNYFDHNSPTYGSPFDMMNQYEIRYNAAGENIAMGQPSPQEVVNDWMNSKGHRENILSKDFNYIGVGYVKDGNYWVQEFIGK
ncbi:sporulation protein [Paenactinomyces guangxiensis]|uniref:Sporulation protein n=1 Tax=Paenactinomyces guangxiensis TaxID=1490290 RepID=A0A7W1WRD0_9BACL|nr:CAP domain-containing protein [Paenactinomyces guangxiensis]MBA4494640.1 sporulation protein [Paenactinomyces guangxiensis]MBH8591597.1 sporulation protein [Paenactinomyces guangxiensis]